MGIFNLLDELLVSFTRSINPLDRDGLFSDDEDLCDHCGELLLFSSSGLCDDCKRQSGYIRGFDDED